jgi:hypothetical protein
VKEPFRVNAQHTDYGLGEQAAVRQNHGQCIEIHAFETSNIDAPHCRRTPWSSEWLDATSRAKVIDCDLRMPLIGTQIRERRHAPQIVVVHPMQQSAAAPTHGTVANPNVIQICIHIELHESAMTRAVISLFHPALLI